MAFTRLTMINVNTKNIQQDRSWQIYIKCPW